MVRFETTTKVTPRFTTFKKQDIEMNSSTTTKATHHKVPLGNFVVEGYLLPNSLWTEANKFGVSKTQAVMLAYPGCDRRHAATKYTQIRKSKVAQSIRPSGFQVHTKIKVIHSGSAKGKAQKVDLLPADQLIPFLKICKRLGSAIADQLIDDLAGLSVQQLFSDAFQLKFDQEDRQAWLVTRQKSKQAFWSLGDAIKLYLTKHESSANYQRFIYPNCQDALNRGLFGKAAKTIREELGVSDLLRDHYGEVALRRIDLVQALAAANIVNLDIEPLDSVKNALAVFNFDVVDYHD